MGTVVRGCYRHRHSRRNFYLSELFLRGKAHTRAHTHNMTTIADMFAEKFRNFCVFLSETALPGVKMTKLDKVKTMPIVDIAYFIGKELKPLEQEIRQYKHHEDTQGAIEFLLRNLGTEECEAVNKLSAPHIHKIILYLNCFLDLLFPEKEERRV